MTVIVLLVTVSSGCALVLATLLLLRQQGLLREGLRQKELEIRELDSLLKARDLAWNAGEKARAELEQKVVAARNTSLAARREVDVMKNDRDRAIRRADRMYGALIADVTETLKEDRLDFRSSFPVSNQWWSEDL